MYAETMTFETSTYPSGSVTTEGLSPGISEGTTTSVETNSHGVTMEQIMEQTMGHSIGQSVVGQSVVGQSVVGQAVGASGDYDYGSNTTQGSLTDPPLSRRYPEKLLRIFASLKRECEIKMANTLPTDKEGTYCARTVDQWGGCWPDTDADATASISCPPIPSLNTYEHATRYCTENGTWFINQNTGIGYVNYTKCFTESDLIEDDTKYIYIFIGGFSVSLVMLALSLAIFLRFKQLRCDRITIHQHLFLSYLLTGVSWILYYMFVVSDGTVLLENPLWCRVLHIMCHYFTVCNFFWMFCEGLYLNIIMVYAFTSSRKLVVVCYIIGWGIPIVLTGTYTGVRNNSPLETEHCWYTESVLQWIMFGPVATTIIVNAAFLINIVRLLITKLRQMPEATQTKKATRATLILVPLLGLQYLLLPIRPPPGSQLEDVYHILVALVTSLQGAFVSLVYCYCNGEVIAVMARKYKQHQLMRKRSNGKANTLQTSGYTSLSQLHFQSTHVNGTNSINRISDELECTVHYSVDM